MRARTREQRLAPVNARLAAISAGFRPAHESITWKPVTVATLWRTQEERWEAHCRQVAMVRDAVLAESGLSGWVAWQVERRRRRNERLAAQRRQRLPRV